MIINCQKFPVIKLNLSYCANYTKKGCRWKLWKLKNWSIDPSYGTCRVKIRLSGNASFSVYPHKYLCGSWQDFIRPSNQARTNIWGTEPIWTLSWYKVHFGFLQNGSTNIDIDHNLTRVDALRSICVQVEKDALLIMFIKLGYFSVLSRPKNFLLKGLLEKFFGFFGLRVEP